jgi:carboxymethylenebutenolidase
LRPIVSLTKTVAGRLKRRWPPSEGRPSNPAPIQAYGETDKNPTPEDAKKFIELLKQHNPNVDMVIYPGAGHAFHADYRPSYNKAAADDGWKRCVGWFDRFLKA